MAGSFPRLRSTIRSSKSFRENFSDLPPIPGGERSHMRQAAVVVSASQIYGAVKTLQPGPGDTRTGGLSRLVELATVVDASTVELLRSLNRDARSELPGVVKPEGVNFQGLTFSGGR